MESTPYIEIIKMLLDLGPIGLVMIIFWIGKQQTDTILRQYKADMEQHSRDYNNNVELVKRYAELAGDLKEIITLNTQTITRLVDKFNSGASK